MVMHAHWSDAYLGRAYPDCGALAEDVALAEFGIDVDLPAPSDSPRANSRLVRELIDTGIARELPDHSGTWLDGDPIMLQPLGSKRLNGHHVGMLCLIRGAWHVLHWNERLGGIRTPLRRLAEAGYRNDGVYRWT